MHFITVPAEQSTAVTDVLLAVVSFLLALAIRKTGKNYDPLKSKIWSWSFMLIGIGAMIGACAHGFEMSSRVNSILWLPINLSLGIAVALFAAGVIYDLKGFKLPKKLFTVLIIVAVIFFTLTVVIPGSFFIFIIYEGVAMLFALSAYLYLALKRKLTGSSFIASGISISIIAAVVQSVQTLQFKLIWIIDHNGLFHIIQIIGLTIMYIGIKKEILNRTEVHSDEK